MTTFPSKEEQNALGIEAIPPGDIALGMLDREQLGRLCGDPRVTRIKAAPEMRPS